MVAGGRHPAAGSALSCPLPLSPPLPPPQFKLWRLDLSDVGSPWHAFAGWDCADPAHKFDARMGGVVRPWPAPAGGGTLRLNMTAGRLYSHEPDMKDAAACAAPGGSGGGARRLQRQLGQRWDAAALGDRQATSAATTTAAAPAARKASTGAATAAAPAVLESEAHKKHLERVLSELLTSNSILLHHLIHRFM